MVLGSWLLRRCWELPHTPPTVSSSPSSLPSQLPLQLAVLSLIAAFKLTLADYFVAAQAPRCDPFLLLHSLLGGAETPDCTASWVEIDFGKYLVQFIPNLDISEKKKSQRHSNSGVRPEQCMLKA